MQSFLSIPTEQNYRQVRYSKASIKPDEDKISESSDDHKPQISDMIQMSSTSPSDSNDDSPGPDNYASSNFNEPEIIAPGQPIRPIKSSTTAYPNNPFEVASSSGKCLFSWFLHSLESFLECDNFEPFFSVATKDGVINTGYVDETEIDQIDDRTASPWQRNQIKEETRQKLDQDQNAARERLGLVRRELSMLAASRDTINIVRLTC